MSSRYYLGAGLAVALVGVMAAPAAPLALAAGSPTPQQTQANTSTTTAAPVPTATKAAPAPTATKAAATATVAATHTVTPTAKVTATPMVTATLDVTPTTVNRGGLVTVSGTGFAANETVVILINGSKTATTAKAGASGALTPTGVTFAYGMKPGVYTLSALGTTSKRSSQAKVTVQQLTPSISLNPATTSPGGTVTVTGKGFGSLEQVTLALNGAAISTTAPITTNNGAFTASFKAPSSLLQGANTVSAIGNQSRVSAVSALTGQLSRSEQYYFAGGLQTADAHSAVNLLNGNGQPANVKLTFYFNNGATDTKTVMVNAGSQKTVTVASLEPFNGTFGLVVSADRSITAQLNINRPGRDGDSLLGNTGLGTTWYLAEGYTGLTFHETVSILNPDQATPAHVQLQILPLGGGPGKSVPVTVPAHSNGVVDINQQFPGKSVSIIATADHPVVVERTLTFSSNGYGMTTRAGTNTAATSWLFAEGTTVNRFQTFLTILNPNATPALVTASFFGGSGNPLGSRTLLVPGLSRGNIKLNDTVNASGIASVVTSDQPVVVERPEYFGSPNGANIAGSDVFGRNGAGVRWSFPGGNTQGNSEFLLLYNPSSATVPVDVTFYGSNGQKITKHIDVQPTQRFTFDVNRLVPGLTPIHGAILSSTSPQGFVAEQTVFEPNHATLRSTEGLAQ